MVAVRRLTCSEHLLAPLNIADGEIWAKLVVCVSKANTVRAARDSRLLFRSGRTFGAAMRGWSGDFPGGPPGCRPFFAAVDRGGESNDALDGGARIDLKRFLPMFRVPELGRGAHDSRRTRQFIFIET
jgi:hypothetical protein